MLARTVTHALVGLDARRVEVEVDVRDGLPGLTIVGLADRACGEARERLSSAPQAAPAARTETNARTSLASNVLMTPSPCYFPV